MYIKSIKLYLIGLGIASIAAGLFIWFGIFNIAATEKHWDATTSLLEIVKDRSIYTRSQGLLVPDLNSSERVARAAPNYKAMCAKCHLAPGIEKSELYEGLYPQPPVFYKRSALSEREPHEAFWVIKNGLKLTGMPAWGIYNSDDQIWDIVAFISSMKNMSPEQYKKLAAAGEHGHAKGNEHGSEMTPDGPDKHSKDAATKPAQAGHSDDAGASKDHHN
ncbi:Cytochrome c family protein [hydrothermal vent metagenome]|uniref:Cytochrome c family protein n=1 Tax=hydrothermal vent metagenome TaxID=652676 RepID=A0A3B0ZHS7_9ZZZZ